MPSYKLTYFNGRGRAECVRLCFVMAGVEFEDKRVTGEEWTALKPSTKYGSLPELEVDGKKFGQSRALMFYLAREFGFYPSNNLEQLQVDEVVFTVEDLVNAIVKVMFCKDEDKEKNTKEFVETVLPKFLGVLEKVLKENKGGNGFFVGDKATAADIAAFDTLSGMDARHPGCMDKFPVLKGFVDRFGAIDKIKAYIAKRPETKF